MKTFGWSPLALIPDETSDLAAAKRKTYLKELGKGDIDWNFLVGTQDNIDKVADTIGFRYVYEPKLNSMPILLW